jgi:hypothetical protein
MLLAPPLHVSPSLSLWRRLHLAASVGADGNICSQLSTVTPPARWSTHNSPDSITPMHLRLDMHLLLSLYMYYASPAGRLIVPLVARDLILASPAPHALHTMKVAAPAALAAPACAPSSPTAVASPPARPSAARFHPQRLRPLAPPAPCPGLSAPLIDGSHLASPARRPRRLKQLRGRAPPAPHDTGRSLAPHAPSVLRRS